MVVDFHPFSLVIQQNREEIEETLQKTLFFMYSQFDRDWLFGSACTQALIAKTVHANFWQSGGFGIMCQNRSIGEQMLLKTNLNI